MTIETHNPIDTAAAVRMLVEAVPNPEAGLPDDVFYYISRTTPLINVDLLVKDSRGRTLLAWRDDPYAGTGWHIPGGIIRFKEEIETRIRKVSLAELGTLVDYDAAPLAINELIHRDRDLRAHFISLLYACRLPDDFIPDNRGRSPGDAGYLQWHTSCPDNLIQFHGIYRKYL